MAADPESDVLALISGNVGSWVENTNLFRGQMQAAQPDSVIPVNAVFVAYTGGPEPLSFGAGSSYSPWEKEFDVQIVIRGAPDKYGTTRSQAQTLFDYVNDRLPTGYHYSRCSTSGPVPLGVDDRRCSYFVINLRMGKLDS